jgi:hypothetical protein
MVSAPWTLDVLTGGRRFGLVHGAFDAVCHEADIRAIPGQLAGM